MAYTPTIWKQGDIITEDKLQKIEDELNKNSDLILVKSGQPNEESNKIWINPEAGESVLVPTYEEFINLEERVAALEARLETLEAFISAPGGQE